MLTRPSKNSASLAAERSITRPTDFVDYLVRQRNISLPQIPELCIISHSQAILDMASADFPRETIDLGARRPVEIHFFGEQDRPAFAMVACPLGAPMAAVLLEELIALGFHSFIAVGIAGHPAGRGGPQLSAGELVLIDRAHIYEGTSQHYCENASVSFADPALTERLKNVLMQHETDFVQGSAATTDAFYRETESFVQEVLEQGAMAVDMELSALFTVSSFHDRRTAALVYISDIIQAKNEEWEMAFADEDVSRAEEQVYRALLGVMEGA